MRGAVMVDDKFIYGEEKQLTVLKTSLFYAGDGFTVYDSKGDVIFRVDSYESDTSDTSEVVLMNTSGSCLLTVRRKRPSLHHRWEGFSGEKTEGQKPIFSVRRSSIMGQSSVTVEVYGKFSEEYQIEGSFTQRCCTIFNSAKESVAEIRRKEDISANVMFGKEVFSVSIKPGFDAAFTMGLILVLDQINGDDKNSEADVDSADEGSPVSS